MCIDWKNVMMNRLFDCYFYIIDKTNLITINFMHLIQIVQWLKFQFCIDPFDSIKRHLFIPEHKSVLRKLSLFVY